MNKPMSVDEEIHKFNEDDRNAPPTLSGGQKMKKIRQQQLVVNLTEAWEILVGLKLSEKDYLKKLQSDQKPEIIAYYCARIQTVQTLKEKVQNLFGKF